MKVLLALTMILLGGLCSSCVSDCGAVGCSDGLSIQVVNAAGQPVDTFTATLTLDGVEQDASCPPLRGNYGNSECLGTTLWMKGNPAHIVLSVESGGEQGALDLEPRYRARYINGPDCAETCRTADMVTVTLAPK